LRGLIRGEGLGSISWVYFPCSSVGDMGWGGGFGKGLVRGAVLLRLKHLFLNSTFTGLSSGAVASRRFGCLAVEVIIQ